MRFTRGAAALVALAGCCTALVACGGESPGAKSPGTAASAVRLPLEVWDYTLPNGLRVILDEDNSAPVVAVHVRYKVGAKDDPPGRAGLAHLFEHFMFQGTHSIPGNVFPALQAVGATGINGTTDWDRTEYFETVPNGALEWALWFEAERMATMRERLDQATFEREKKVVKNELRQNYENRRGGFFWAIRQRALYGDDHPYGHPPIGSLDELDRASLDELHAFHKLYYAPSNAVIALVGDFDHKKAKAWIAQYFAPIPAGGAKPIRTPRGPSLSGERRVAIEARVDHPYVMVSYAAPPEGSPDLPALDAVLGHLAGSVEWYLAENRKVARDARATLDTGLLSSMADISVELAPDGDVDEALRVLDKTIFEDKPSDFGAMNSAFNRLMLHEVLGYEHLASRAARYAHDDDVTANPLFLAKALAAIQSSSRAEAFAAREKYLKTRNRVVTVVTPNASAPMGGRLAGGAR